MANKFEEGEGGKDLVAGPLKKILFLQLPLHIHWRTEKDIGWSLSVKDLLELGPLSISLLGVPLVFYEYHK